MKNLEKTRNEEPGATGKCEFFSTPFITSPAELISSPGATKTKAGMHTLFAQLDENEDGKVTREECLAGLPGAGPGAAFERACAAATGSCDRSCVTEEDFGVFQTEVNGAGSAETARPLFLMKDVDGDGCLSKAEFNQPLSALVADLQARSGPGGAVVTLRILREELVNKPRRRLRERKLHQAEAKLRTKMRRRLGTMGAYERWLGERKTVGEQEVRRRRRRLAEEEGRIRRLLMEERRRRRLAVPGEQIVDPWSHGTGLISTPQKFLG